MTKETINIADSEMHLDLCGYGEGDEVQIFLELYSDNDTPTADALLTLDEFFALKEAVNRMWATMGGGR